jgi:hypothetical protein
MDEFIRRMEAECLRRYVRLGHMVDLAEEGAAGLLLFFPSLIILLPLSIIPGLSTACAVLLLFVAAQSFLGMDTLWLPQRLRNLSIRGARLFHVLQKLEKPARRIDRLSKPRLDFLTRGIAARLAALVSCFLSIITIFIGFLPFIDVLLMLPVVLFSLGMSTGDGVAAALGWVVLLCYGLIPLFAG